MTHTFKKIESRLTTSGTGIRMRYTYTSLFTDILHIGIHTFSNSLLQTKSDASASRKCRLVDQCLNRWHKCLQKSFRNIHLVFSRCFCISYITETVRRVSNAPITLPKQDGVCEEDFIGLADGEYVDDMPVIIGNSAGVQRTRRMARPK